MELPVNLAVKLAVEPAAQPQEVVEVAGVQPVQVLEDLQEEPVVQGRGRRKGQAPRSALALHKR